MAARAEVDYNFISNEIYVGFRTRDRQERRRLWGVFPSGGPWPRR